MNLLRKILFPIGIIYWLVTYVRNWLYDIKFFRAIEFDDDLPIIAIGNLSVGGTGKTPHTEFLIRLLKDNYKVAVLSRGYKRSTKGFVLANESVSAAELGDESYQIHKKFPDVTVAVCEDRKLGIFNLLYQEDIPEIVLLDDAFQHRKVKAGFYILLTAYDDLFSDDYILPFGNLREPSLGKKRADVVIVTKCPKQLSENEQEKVKQKLNVNVPVFFTAIDYDSEVFGAEKTMNASEVISTEKTIVAGIAKPKYFIDYLNSGKDAIKIYPDHHNFSDAEIAELNVLSQEKIIVTTEKDFVRLQGKVDKQKLFYLPIKIQFLNNQDAFQSSIKKFVSKK